MYPLDTIRVKCQSDGIGTLAAIRALVRPDQPLHTLKALYAGFGPYVVSAAVFGSLYFGLYASLKRLGDNYVAGEQEPRHRGPAATVQRIEQQQRQREAKAAAAAAAARDSDQAGLLVAP